MYTTNLFNRALIRPTRGGARKLVVVTGYASPNMVREHFENAPPGTEIELIIGMTSFEGMPRYKHSAFRSLSTERFRGRFECRYVTTTPAVHSKAYVWFNNGAPETAFVGSANYSIEAFRNRRELLIDADATVVADYASTIRRGSIDCRDSRVEDRINLTNRIPRLPPAQGRHPPRRGRTPIPITPGAPEDIEISLLTRNGEVGSRSGLNWGQRPELRRNPDQAYIPIPSSLGRSGYFPPKGSRFTLVTDDGQSFEATIAQQGNKAIHTPDDNSLLGAYFRRRLGLGAGEFIRAADLRRYGRTNLKFQKLGEDTYLMDFAQPAGR